MSIPVTPNLRTALLLDAIASGAVGLAMAAGASLLAPLLSLPEPLLFWAGLAFLPWAAALIWAARRQTVARILVIDIIALNALFVAICMALPASGLIAPNMLGTLFILAQGAIVAGFAILQWIQLRAAAAVTSTPLGRA